MESIYYVMSWACHRRCKHCYEERFRPYVRGALEDVVRESERNFPRIIDNLPERLTYRDLDQRDADGGIRERPGRIILSGGEALIDPVRERVTYKVIERLAARYRGQGVRIILQTTGDLLTDAIVDDLVARGVWLISIASIDDFHVGMEGEAKQRAFVARVTDLLERHGLRAADPRADGKKRYEPDGPFFSFFGASPDSWIGKLWPRGRAWQNGLSTATLADNFCNRWSGGLNFLAHRDAGSEVSIEPDGSVYPCCIKTKLPVGNLTEERLLDILDSLAGDPVYEAINAGKPERMGLSAGWSIETFLEKSRTTTPGGARYENLCIGCDRFHEEVLAPRIAAAHERRRRMGVAAE
jgi:sulfatase maturation enzyme AslB (radical SAM superfamily)